MLVHPRRIGQLASVFGVALLLVNLHAPVRAQTASFIGAWELDRFKSVYDPITTAPGKQFMTIEATATAGEVTITIRTWRNQVASDTTYTVKFDRMEYATSAPRTTVQFTQVDANTVERTARLFDEVRETATWSVSQDGMMLTIERKGTDTAGTAYSSKQIYMKVAGNPIS